MPEQSSNCPICGSAHVKTDPGDLDFIVLNCNRCGRYRTEFRSLAVIKKLIQDRDPDFVRLRPYLSAHLRQASERGEMIDIRHDNWQSLAEGHAHTPVPRKLDMLLRLCGMRSPIGKAVAIDPDDFVLLDAADVVEMNYLTEALLEQQVLRVGDPYPHRSYTVTPKGWERLSPIDPGGVPGTCFVAMAFDPSLDGVYEGGIKPAVEASGLTVIHVGKMPFNGIVTDLIHAEIRRAQVIVADVTLQRQSVYFEAGLAIGLGRMVVFSCHEDEIKQVHFDTRQYNHVVWKDAADLRAKLEVRIRGTLTIPVRH